MEQSVGYLGHEGCIAAVVPSLIALVVVTLIVSILIYCLCDMWGLERGLIRDSAERMQKVEGRQALYSDLVSKGANWDGAMRAVNRLNYD